MEGVGAVENAPVISCLLQDLFVTLTNLSLRPFTPSDILSKWLRGLLLVPWVNFVRNDLRKTSDVSQWQEKKLNSLGNLPDTDRDEKPELSGTPMLLQLSYLEIHAWGSPISMSEKRQSYLWQTQRCHWLGRKEGHWHSCLVCCWCQQGSVALQPDWRWC